MGSYAGLYAKEKHIFSFKNESYGHFAAFFTKDELVHLKGSKALPYATNWDVGDLEDDEYDDVEVYLYRVKVSCLVDRMDVAGLTSDLAQRVFKELIDESLEREKEYANDKYFRSDVKQQIRREIEYLSNLSYDSWTKRVKDWLSAPNDDSLRIARGSVLDNPLVLFDYGDERLLLRVLIDQLSPEDEVTLDLSDVYEGGWVQEPNSEIINAQEESFTKDLTPPIIITEGTFDVYAIENAIEILRPHLKGYVKFLDFEQKNEGGASAAVRLLKALAAAGVTNRVLAIFDNDTAAREELGNLQDVKLPEHFKITKYPEIGLMRKYPTKGAQGELEMDVNGYAGSIEMYLGKDSLTHQDELTPVVWKGRMGRTGDYQGEVDNKSEVQKRYRHKIALCKRIGVQRSQDWSGMEAIIDHIVEELSTLQFVKNW